MWCPLEVFQYGAVTDELIFRHNHSIIQHNTFHNNSLITQKILFHIQNFLSVCKALFWSSFVPIRIQTRSTHHLQLMTVYKLSPHFSFIVMILEERHLSCRMYPSPDLTGCLFTLLNSSPIFHFSNNLVGSSWLDSDSIYFRQE